MQAMWLYDATSQEVSLIDILVASKTTIGIEIAGMWGEMHRIAGRCNGCADEALDWVLLGWIDG